MYAKKNSGKKVFAMLLAVVLLIGIGIGGTLAWLQDTTSTVTNTFTVGNVNIDLTETVGDTSESAKDEEVSNDTFKIVPGTEQDKNPTVIVEENSEACWLFVEIVESNNYIGDTNTRYITWSVDSAWTLLSETDNDGVRTYVYYIEHAATTEDVPNAVLADNKVSYAGTLTKADLEALGTTMPALTFKAYAIQSESLKDASNNAVTEASAAWSLLNP